MKDTEPVSPKLPPYFVKEDLTSDAVLLRLSVTASTINAIPPGAYPSYLISSKFRFSPDSAFFMTLSILSLGIFTALQADKADLNLGLLDGSVPPLTATCNSFVKRANFLALLASCAPLRCIIFLNFE